MSLTTISIKQAYADCWDSPWGDKAYEVRNLNYRARMPITRRALDEIIPKYIGEYNDFNPDVWAKISSYFPNDAKYYMAREGSVCIYVKLGKTRLWDRNFNAISRLCDECSVESDGTIRLWWD